MKRNEAGEIIIPKILECVYVLKYMEEFAELLVPVTDPRHQVVERVVQHLAQRNKDIPEVSQVTWSVHLVQSHDINAFVLPVSKRKTDVELFDLHAILSRSIVSPSLKSYVRMSY